MESLLLNFAEHIQAELKKACIKDIPSQLTHNHPPMRRIVHDCPYCQKHGNIVLKFQRNVSEPSDVVC